MAIDNKTIGMFYVILGIILGLFFVGPFLIRIVGAIFAFMLINYGLKLLGKPSIQILFFQTISTIRLDWFRKH